MTDPSVGRKKKRITITASLKGVEVAEKALIRMGFESKANFAKSQLLARSTVTKFFRHDSIQLDSFKKICEALKLNWKEIAELAEEKQLEQLEKSDSSSSIVNQGVVSTLRPYSQVTVIDKQTKKVKIEIRLTGQINSVDNLKFLELILQEYSGDTIEITGIKEGSIRLFVEGSPEDIERLVSRIKSGELKTVAGFPVEDVQILSESSDDDESSESDEKWRLVQEIVNQPIQMRRLSGADLSDADLSGADLSGADLSGADLSGADLSGANLRDADLRDADLRDADFRDTDLWVVNLSNANLSNADLKNAKLLGANLSDAKLFGASLSNADLFGADLRNADVSHANLFGAILSGAILSGADLSYANLFGANLFNANLNSTDLRNAKLSSADLRNANLSDADLRNANLSDADLRNANLSDANSENTIVANTLFGYNLGLAENTKRDLKRRGAIFGDRPPVLSPR